MIDSLLQHPHLPHELLSSDARFDALFPTSMRFYSRYHWTPVDVAVRACALLAPAPGTRVLDVGCGVGKVCLIGALTTAASWCGIERNAKQVSVASRVARELAVEGTVQFVQGELAALDWSAFDAFYFFNPFSERLLDHDRPSGERWARFHRDVEHARSMLDTTRPGTRVVTYHGIGGDMTDSFDLVHREAAGNDELSLWIKRSG